MRRSCKHVVAISPNRCRTVAEDNHLGAVRLLFGEPRAD
jgi:hypothetical protein